MGMISIVTALPGESRGPLLDRGQGKVDPGLGWGSMAKTGSSLQQWLVFADRCDPPVPYLYKGNGSPDDPCALFFGSALFLGQ